MNSELSDLMLLYVAGVAEADESARIEAWLAGGDPEAFAELARARATLGLLPKALDPAEPSPELWSRIAEKLDAPVASTDRPADRAPDRGDTVPYLRPSPEAPRGPTPRPWQLDETAPSPVTRVAGRSPWMLTIAASVAAALVTGIVASYLTHLQIAPELTRLQEKVDGYRSLSKRLERELIDAKVALDDSVVALREMRESMALLTDPTLRTVDLKGTAEMPNAVARVMFEPQKGQLHLSAVSLSALASGRTYELWFLTDSTPPIPLGTFSPNPDGTATFRTRITDSSAKITAIAISIEPAGGVPTPTGPIVLSGNVPQ